MTPGDSTIDIRMSKQIRWHPPSDEFIKINWDAAINEKERCIGLGIVARDCMGEFMGAKCIMKPIVVEARLAEAMAALWAVLYGKEAGFQKIVFEGDAAQVVTEIHSSPPYLSKDGQMIESIQEELVDFRGAKFVHVNRECNTAAHALAKEAVKRRLSMCWSQVVPDCISSIIRREHLCP